MEAHLFAQSVAEKFGTRDVFAIAERAGLKVIYESWYPITVGEFDRKMGVIHVNRRALETEKPAADRREKLIVAHELGHFFATGLNLNKTEEETFAHRFAESLTLED